MARLSNANCPKCGTRMHMVYMLYRCPKCGYSPNTTIRSGRVASMPEDESIIHINTRNTTKGKP